MPVKVYWTVLMTITMIIMPKDENNDDDDDSIFDNDTQMMLMSWINMIRTMKKMAILYKYCDVFCHDIDDDLW